MEGRLSLMKCDGRVKTRSYKCEMRTPDASEKTMARAAMTTSPYRHSSQQLVSLKRSERVFLRLIFHCMVFEHV